MDESVYPLSVRVLVAIRQSKRKERSESPSTQREAIQRWADQHGHTIAAEAVDVGVSAKVSPFDRPNLGPWLSEPSKLAQWDIIAGWKVDRVVRSLVHFYGELMPRLTELGKNAVAVTEGVDTSTSSAIEVSLRVAIAQDELQKLRDRATGTRAGHRKRGTFPGGPVPFGYRPIKADRGWTLVADPDAAEALRSVVGMLLDGSNLNQCIRWLNDHRVLTAWDRNAIRAGREPKGRIWRRRTLHQLLRSPHLLGYGIYRGEIIRDDQNEPIMFGEPLLDRPTWDRLQVVVNPETRPWVRRSGGAMLRDVAYCAYCGRKLYQRPERPSDKRRYVCAAASMPPGTRDCFALSVIADDLEESITELFLAEYGETEIVEVQAIRSDDPSIRLSEIEESLTSLETDRYVKGRFQGRESAYERLVDGLERERTELLARQAQRGIEVIRTGRTFGQEWKDNPEGRGDLLRKHCVTVMVGAHPWYMWLTMPTPEELRETM